MATDPRRRRRPSIDLPLAWAGLAVVAVAAIMGAAILLTRPAPDAAAEQSASASTPAGAFIGDPVAAPDSIEAAAWWRVGWQDAEHPADGFDEVSVGIVGLGTTARVPFGELQAVGPPFVRGPVGGRVLVATREERRTRLLVVEAATGRVRELIEVAGSAPDAEMTADGRSVVFLAETDAGLAAYVIPIGGAGEIRQLTQARPRTAEAPGIVLAARILPSADLILDPAGLGLAILDCNLTCRLRVVALDGGEEIDFDLGQFDSVAEWDRDVIVLGSGRCIDLSRGAFMPDSCARPEQPEPPTPLSPWFAGIELPVGWTVELQSGPEAPPMAFEQHAVARGPNGEEIVLDALGAFFGQG